MEPTNNHKYLKQFNGKYQQCLCGRVCQKIGMSGHIGKGIHNKMLKYFNQIQKNKLPSYICQCLIKVKLHDLDHKFSEQHKWNIKKFRQMQLQSQKNNIKQFNQQKAQYYRNSNKIQHFQIQNLSSEERRLIMDKQQYYQKIKNIQKEQDNINGLDGQKQYRSAIQRRAKKQQMYKSLRKQGRQIEKSQGKKRKDEKEEEEEEKKEDKQKEKEKEEKEKEEEEIYMLRKKQATKRKKLQDQQIQMYMSLLLPIFKEGTEVQRIVDFIQEMSQEMLAYFIDKFV